MSRPTSIIDSSLVRQAPISILLGVAALLSVVLPTLGVSNDGVFVASIVVISLATLVAVASHLFPGAQSLVSIVIVLDFLAVALLRTGTGAETSVFTSLVVLPVVWCASLRGRQTVVFAAVGVTAVILAPVLLRPGTPIGSSELVRLGITVVVFGTVAGIVQELSRHARQSVQTAEASEAVVRDEISRAGAVQRSLLPTTRVDADGAALSRVFDGLRVAGACMPAKTVGGDFFDWYSTPQGLAVSLGDVMGKGVGAGLIAAAVRATLRSARTVDDPSEALRRASDGLTADNAAMNVTFTTLFHARFGDDGSVRWADAGHGLSFILRADRTDRDRAGSGSGTGAGTGTGDAVDPIERLHSVDLPLGLGIRDEWATSATTLGPGDLLIAFSDGVLDLFDGNDDAVDQVAALVSADHDPAALVAALSERAASVPHDDDVTIIAVRRDLVTADTEDRAGSDLTAGSFHRAG
ncbi:PP2C family protein-serine/threonine phosphatase [Curtobacterium sp. ISL-83]|uniref:PP2C family protein-serine/threonine phosphatase n=1 Tax=Curtobacterium sp. ISL-83 TaxID=2819145 RepID=UPI001BE7A710|nr:SpoIIE family protein phosphatase [Curtobacterium sp. ISL-83]MBT2502705.1 SpoIIE family protein phosphatase [Curtobacterium sp. ISL-83]